MTEPGTVFLDRYRFESERPISVGVCDCGGRYALVVRKYIDLNNQDDAGVYSHVETSVRTGCHCTEERDPFRQEQPQPVKLEVKGEWRVERVQRPIYRIREDGS